MTTTVTREPGPGTRRDRTTPPEPALGPAPEPPSGPLTGVPGLVGLPVVVAGGTGLALTDLGAFADGAGTATLTLLLGCTVVGLAVATVWAAALGDSVSASLYAVFGGFYASDVVLSASSAHDWFGPVGGDAADAWLTCWLVVFVLLVPLCLRLPAITTLMLVLVVTAVALLLAAGLTDSTPLLRLGGVGVLGFVATVAWQYADLMLVATGGRGLPMGRPVLR